jgi:spore coat polysaccharide biosynthesis protein SpsF (cytidylyltransferase family)
MSDTNHRSDKNIPVFITARIGSTRLPGKHLLPLCGRPVIEQMITRIKHSRIPGLFVLCTTVLDEDTVFQETARHCNIEIFRGHPTDILQRWLDAADHFKADYFISAEADDVFCDPDYIDIIARELTTDEYDYITCKGLPFGATPTGINVAALRKICAMKDDDDTQGQERYFTKTGLFRVKYIQVADPVLNQPDVRMTLDYQEDYDFFKAVFEHFYPGKDFFSLHEILVLLRDHPEIARINEKMQEKYQERYDNLYGTVTLKNKTA